jgi:xanthine dehydrogenase accessory factor
MTGSLRKINTMKENLKKERIPEEAFSKLKAPIGLDIGAETPEEIASGLLQRLLQ